MEALDSRDKLFEQVEGVLQEENYSKRGQKWEEIHNMVHQNAVMLPLWGVRFPTVLNNQLLTNFQPGNQQFDYPVHRLKFVQEDTKTVTIVPGAQSGLFPISWPLGSPHLLTK